MEKQNAFNYFKNSTSTNCGKRDNRYAPSVEHGDFCESLEKLNKKSSLYIVSYDGRLGNKTYGKPMPKSLNLYHIEIDAGRGIFESAIHSPIFSPKYFLILTRRSDHRIFAFRWNEL